MSTAPNEGPVATASAPMPPQSATTWERFSLEYDASKSESDAGSNAAAPNP